MKEEKDKTLEDLFIDELKDIYNAENQILKALPKMAKSASSEQLESAFNEHLEQTKEHVNRLEKVFDSLGVPRKGKKCEAMEGLLEEGKTIMKEHTPNTPVLDAALISAAQKVEHYEIASYGCACTFAKLLNHEEAARLLHETLEEEKETDQKLTEIAEKSVNSEALEEVSIETE
jgi:ferritin-like metal-binding protein YciE